jgi:3-oxoacyl-[acyl-carrier protein] reductase
MAAPLVGWNAQDIRSAKATTTQGNHMDLGLRGKAALVCASSKGLGRGCASALAAEGADLVLVARGRDALEATARALREATGAQVVAIAADITTDAGRALALEAARELRHGAPAAFDIVVTNAGGPPMGDFREFDRAAWLQAVEANMLTPIELIKATVDGMAARGWGRIVNVTSSSVKAPIASLSLSNGARSGLTGFVAGVAREVAGRGVTINNLLPGAFATDRLLSSFAPRAQRLGVSADEVARQRAAAIPAGRFGTPEEFGAACAFLCSAQAGYITGQNVLIDGGAYPGTL